MRVDAFSTTQPLLCLAIFIEGHLKHENIFSLILLIFVAIGSV